MNKTIQMLVETISLIPRQFYRNQSEEDASGLVHQQFTSQLAVRYRKLTGNLCRSELYLPSSEVLRKFASTPDKKAMVRRLATGISDPKPSLFIENTANLPLSQVTIIELTTDSKLKRGAFYWDLFKLHFLVDQNRNSCGIYCIINQDAPSIQKKIDAYYKREFYTSFRAENIFFLIKKNYNSNMVVLNYKGEAFNF